MKRQWKVNYEEKVDHFKKHKNVRSVLIYGAPNENAFISYVIPVYKRADLLEKTLDCILKQQEVAFEWNIVIVDNEAGGINDTQLLVEKINSDKIVYYRNEENIGVDGNYNRCIEMAQSPWVAMIHGDDLIMDDHLKCSGEYIKYIESLGNQRQLAYICQRYIDFSCEDGICLHRENGITEGSRYNYDLQEVYHQGKPQLQPREIGVITGYYAAIPSFGTIMNREIMLKEGGFSDTLGICEDVITPFRLAEKYDVYLAPVYMGFHRFDRNESMNPEVILKIYEAMIEFRDYMYTTVWWGNVWKSIARDTLNCSLRNYCIGQSTFCSRILESADFDGICKVEKPGKVKTRIFDFWMNLFIRKYDLCNNRSYISGRVKACQKQIEDAIKNNKKFLIYGAGMAAEELIPILKEQYEGIDIIGCAVSNESLRKKIKGVPISLLDDYGSAASESAVITATVTWEYQLQMNQKLSEKGFDTVINLLT